LLNRSNQAQQEVVRALTNATVQAIGHSVERELASMITTLRVLSSSQNLALNSLAAFHQRGTVALAGTGSYLIAFDGDFNQLLNTRVPFGEKLGRTSDPASATAALERDLPIVSRLFFGQTAQQWVFNVLLPIKGVEGIPLLALTRNAQALTSALQARQLPEGWNAALVDDGNLVIAATPNAGLEIGTALAMRQSREQAPDAWQREFLAGQQVVTSEWRSSLSGWRVIAWAETAVVDRPLGDSLLWLGAWGVLIAIVAGLLALLIGQRIGASVRGLRRDAQRLGHGEVVEGRDYPAEAALQGRAADEEVRFLMRELAHRSKNQMTVIAAMAKQTARGADNVPTYVDAFERRILGLARSTDLLLANGRAGVSLRELVESQIASFSPAEPERVTLEGPDLRLNMQAAQILGMALHELSTNAVKYGAFAGDEGQLTVQWTCNGKRLELVWREVVPHVLEPSERRGFGTTVLKTMVGGSLKADVERKLHAHGIEWRFSIPKENVSPDLLIEGESAAAE
jgi:two-component sensor histidine kinase